MTDGRFEFLYLYINIYNIFIYGTPNLLGASKTQLLFPKSPQRVGVS